MRLLRFMSRAELDKFLAGELLENTTDHHLDLGQRTDAIGFCFLDYDKYDEQYAYHFLSGIVSQDVAAVFEIDDDMVKGLKRGQGTFADPNGRLMDSMLVDELSTERYHNKAMRLIKYSEGFAWHFKDGTHDRVFEWRTT